MKRLKPSEAKRGGRIGYGEIITEYQRSFVATTGQVQQGYATADTFAYLIVGEYKNGDFKLIKHPSIKGTKGYKALGG